MSPSVKRWMTALGAVALAAAVKPASAATGLLGKYYTIPADVVTAGLPSPDLSWMVDANLDAVRVDPTLNYNFDTGGAPRPAGVPHDNFGAFWTGSVKAPATGGPYALCIGSDDGTALWLNPSSTNPADLDPTSSDLVASNWAAQGTTYKCTDTALAAGSTTPVAIAYYQGGGGTNVYLRWTDDTTANPNGGDIVPTEALTPTATTDTQAPANITDLAVSATTGNSATLTFTAPADAPSGNALNYGVYYALVPITAANLGQTTRVDVAKPKAAGQAESFTVTGLSALQKYYFAVVAGDASGNYSGLSNVVSGSTPAGTLNLPTFPTIAKADMAVYYDDNQTTNWISRAGAQATRDYFVAKGYTLVDADGLATFMQAHAASKVPSAVVMGNDIFPGQVVESAQAGDTTALTNDNTVNHYMANGGRVIFYGDWPFYNISNNNTNFNPAGTGQCQILGFCEDGTGDTNDNVLPSAEAIALGLTSTWQGQRPQKPGDVDTVLFTSKGGVAGWIKYYPDMATSNGGGFYRLVDHAQGVPTADQLSDGQKLAEASGSFNAPSGRLTGRVLGPDGNALVGAVVTITNGTNTYKIPTDNFGIYSSLLPLGSYTTSVFGNVNGITGTFTATGSNAVTQNALTSAADINMPQPSLPDLPAPVDKAVFFDSSIGTGWFNATIGQQLSDYLTGKGYTLLDVASLGTFMSSHAASKVPSVVVLAQDQMPSTVIDLTNLDANGNPILSNNNIFNDYLKNSGRVIWPGDWPFYNLIKDDGTIFNPGGGGQCTILGFCEDGANDRNDNVVVTPVGAKIGLTSTWPSARPQQATTIDAMIYSGSGGAAGWIKLFPDNKTANPGAFIRVIDAPGVLSDANEADIQKLAEYSGSLVPGGVPVGCTPGDVNADSQVNVSDAVLVLKASVSLVTLTADQIKAADVAADGAINVADAVKILKHAVGLPDATWPTACAG